MAVLAHSAITYVLAQTCIYICNWSYIRPHFEYAQGLN